MDVIRAIHERLPRDPHGDARLLLGAAGPLQAIINEHGGEMPRTWGVPVAEIHKGIRHGVRKINIDTDCRMAMTGQFRKVAMEKKAEFEPLYRGLDRPPDGL